MNRLRLCSMVSATGYDCSVIRLIEMHGLIRLGLVGAHQLLEKPSSERRISNTANVASLLWHAFHALPSPSNQVNWAGFYVADPTTTGRLILGPFQGKVKILCKTSRVSHIV